MKRKFFSAIVCSAVALIVLTSLLNADEIKNAGLVRSVKDEYQALWKSSLQKYVDGIERAEEADRQYVRDNPGCKGTIRNQSAYWASTITGGFNEIFNAASSYDFDKAAMLWNAPNLNKGAPRHAAGHTLGGKESWPEEIKPALGALRQFYSGDDIYEFERSVIERIFPHLRDFSDQVEKTVSGFFTSLDQRKLIYYYNYDKTTHQFSYDWPACAQLTNFFKGKDYDIGLQSSFISGACIQEPSFLNLHLTSSDNHNSIYLYVIMGLKEDGQIQGYLANGDIIDQGGDCIIVKENNYYRLIHFFKGRKTIAVIYQTESSPGNDDMIRYLIFALRDYVRSGGGGAPPPAQDTQLPAGTRIELAPLTSTNLTTTPGTKSACTLQVTVAKADGLPAAGATIVFEKPNLGILSATQVKSDARGQAQVTYTAPTEQQLAGTGKKEVPVVITARAPDNGAKDTVALTIRSLTGDITASAEHDILPAHPDYYNQIGFRFQAANKPDGSPYRARITARQQWGAFVKGIHQPGGTVTYEMDVWPNNDCEVYYHWTGPPSMMKAADETVTVEIPEKNLRYDVTFSVGMDLRIVAVERKDNAPLFPVMWEPFHVYVEDKFHPAANLEELLKKFRIQLGLKIEQTAYEPAAPDYSQGSLASVLITRIEGMSANTLRQAVIWDAGSWQVKKTKDNRYVVIQRGEYEDGSAWQEYPAIVFWERGTYRFQVAINAGPFDADPRNNSLPSPSLKIEEFRGFSDELIHTVFLPSLEFLAGAAMSFTKEGTLIALKTTFCIKGLTSDILAKDYGNVLIDVWGCALTGLDEANISQKIKDTFKLQELGTYVASLAKSLYEQARAKGETPGAGETKHISVPKKSNSSLTFLAKGLYDEVSGKEGALANSVAKAALGDQGAVPATNLSQGRFSLDDVLRVTQLAVKGMKDHYVVIVQREGLSGYTAMTSDGMKLTRAPYKLGAGKSSAERIEETATVAVIPASSQERLVLDLSGTTHGGQLITVTPNRIMRYDYPRGTWQSTVTVDSSGTAKFSTGQTLSSAQQPAASPDGHPAAAPQVSFAGIWKTEFGTLTVTQNGKEIHGQYSHDNGKIEGTIEGGLVRGRWSEGPSYTPPKDAGDFEFVISGDGNSFKGKWSYGFGNEKWHPTWNGTRIK